MKNYFVRCFCYNCCCFSYLIAVAFFTFLGLVNYFMYFLNNVILDLTSFWCSQDARVTLILNYLIVTGYIAVKWT
jgi:hypothetical protein